MKRFMLISLMSCMFAGHLFCFDGTPLDSIVSASESAIKEHPAIASVVTLGAACLATRYVHSKLNVSDCGVRDLDGKLDYERTITVKKIAPKIGFISGLGCLALCSLYKRNCNDSGLTSNIVGLCGAGGLGLALFNSHGFVDLRRGSVNAGRLSMGILTSAGSASVIGIGISAYQAWNYMNS